MVGLAGMTAAALLAAAGSANAHDPASHGAALVKKNVVQKSQQPAQAARSAPGLTIARDADTGVLRAPTDAEAAALAAPTPAEEAVVVEFVTAAGVIAAQVPESMLTYTVVSKTADGSIDSICLPTKEAAESAVQKLARTPQATPARAARTSLRPAPGAPNE